MRKVLRQMPDFFPGLKSYQKNEKKPERQSFNLLKFFLNQILFLLIALNITMHLSDQNLAFNLKNYFLSQSFKGFKKDEEHFSLINKKISDSFSLFNDKSGNYHYLKLETEINGDLTTDFPDMFKMLKEPSKYFYLFSFPQKKESFYKLESENLTDHINSMNEIFKNNQSFLKKIQASSYGNSVYLFCNDSKLIHYLEFVVIFNELGYEIQFVQLMDGFKNSFSESNLILNIIIISLISVLSIITPIISYFGDKKKILQLNYSKSKLKKIIHQKRLFYISKISLYTILILISQLFNNNFFISYDPKYLNMSDFNLIMELKQYGLVVLGILFLIHSLQVFFLFEFNTYTKTMIIIFNNSFRFIGFVIFQLLVFIFSFCLFHSIIITKSENSINDHLIVNLTRLHSK